MVGRSCVGWSSARCAAFICFSWWKKVFYSSLPYVFILLYSVIELSTAGRIYRRRSYPENFDDAVDASK